MKKLLILNFHRLVEFVDSPSRIENMYNVRRKDFIHQLEIIEKNNVPVISLQDAISGNFQHPFSVVFTVDNGNNSDFSVAAKILNAYQYPAAFFPTIANIEAGLISEDEIRSIAEMGMDIGSKGIHHPNLKELSRHQQLLELSDSKRELEKIIDNNISFFALPNGLYNRQTLGVAREAGYQAILTGQFRVNKNVDKQFILHRWSIKNNTSLKEFEKVVTQNSLFIQRKTLSANLNNSFRNMVGLKAANSLSEGLARLSAAPTKG